MAFLHDEYEGKSMTTETPAADVVERLQRNAGWRNEQRQTVTDPALLTEAADEITRLRAENTELQRRLDEAVGFQQGVDQWMDSCFGEPIKSDSLERADRFTEESLELAQAIPGFTAERAHALVDYVFNRPIGELRQEVGGTIVCLAALCNTFGISIQEEANRELARIWTKVDQIRSKQAAKPTGSALPMAVTTSIRGEA